MSLISIDQSKCKRDGICAAECPFHLIVLQGEKGFPEIQPEAEQLCIECGHCVSVCPHGALSLASITPDDCLDIPFGPAPDLKKAAQLLQGRRSIRSYQKDLVPHEHIKKILEVCRWAPSARNEQPTHWLIIENQEEVRRLAGHVVDWLRKENNYPGLVNAWDHGKDMVLRGAPHLAVVHASTLSSKPQIDCTIALTYFDLAASSHGIGCCWAGILMSAVSMGYQPLLDALALPEGHDLYGAMMFGYPRFPYFRIPPRKPLAATWRK
ncbi:MAG: nitroreductase family protein [Desulfobulbaceae bacterium]|nr:nitroreductase family protein [Desulfobulbaceae bacterium]